jgi:hypothetical protein
VIPAEYERRWLDLDPPSSPAEMSGTEIEAPSGVWIARDDIGRRHLLIKAPADVQIRSVGTQGLGVSVGKRIVAGGAEAHVIDLVCLDSAVAATFAAVAANVVTRIQGSGIDARGEEVTAVLNEWRWFWGVDPEALSAKDAVGLFGELWFLLRWSGISQDSVKAWGASAGARHDFQWVEQSVEVKVTSKAGPIIHTIENLQQLADPETGDLYLFSMRILRDSLASNSVDSLVAATLEVLQSDAVTRAEILEKLARRGYTPAGTKVSGVTYRVIEQSLYRVADDFPRLVPKSFPEGLPSGITDVSYQLDMSACSDWLTGVTSEAWASVKNGN